MHTHILNYNLRGKEFCQVAQAEKRGLFKCLTFVH